MTQEERQLLLIDVSARLPYGVYVHFCNTNIDEKLTEISLGETISQIRHNGKGNQGLIKPYLRPLSSMTGEENKEFQQVIEIELKALEGPEGHTIDSAASSAFQIDFYNKHHFDYRGLIPLGLALEAPAGMYV